MPDKRYWGPNNEYGPYTPQADGWPNAGEVIRDYRIRVKRLSAAELARLYSEAMGEEPPVTERWIQRMEHENKIPTELPRRRALISILGIPPLLLGLSSSEDLQPKAPQSPTQTINVSAYSTMLTMYWHIDHTSTAQQSLTEIEAIIAQLRAEAKKANHTTYRHMYELLCGYYNLASIIYADKLNYEKAYNYADNAVSLARVIQNNKLLAVSLYQRGFVRQQQVIHASEVNPLLLQSALDDYNEALPLSTPKVESGMLMDMALVNALLKRPGAADSYLAKAGVILDRGGLDEGTFIDAFADSGLGRYRLGQASVFTTLKRYDDASDLLFEAKELLNPTQTRRFAWADIIESQIAFGQRQYPLAAQSALRALKTCKAINSQNNIHLIQTLYTQLLKTSYANSQIVKELGAALILL